MSTFKQIFYHIVFSTKYRKPTIPDKHCEELYKYIWGIINKRNCKLYRINGTENHLHIFSDLHPSVCLADYIRDVKVNSAIWMKKTGKFPDFSCWQFVNCIHGYSQGSPSDWWALKRWSDIL